MPSRKGARKIWRLPLEPPSTRFVAFERKAAKWPSALITGFVLIPLPPRPSAVLLANRMVVVMQVAPLT
jgi:hypothetical protein